MGCYSLRSLLLAAIVLSNCITWTASRHHYTHKIHGHRSRHRRQGNGPYHPPTYVNPQGDGGGAWGEWGEVSPCSRTCGGGVSSQKRICLQIGSDGQPLCAGGDTRYFSCNTQDCPPGSKDFREEQCAAYNRRPNDNLVPYLNGPNPCELNCMPKGEWYHNQVSPKVIDGTLCNSDSFDVCVDGICQPVGCDRMLGSGAREDKCRQCRGNGTNCDTVVGVVDGRDFRNGYNDVLFIPQGAMNIQIEEIQPSDNYFALRAADSDKFYMHGGYVINGNPRSMLIAGTIWHYDRIAGFKSPDKLRCLGPTNEALYLSLLLTQENVGIRYEYSIPSSEAPPPTQQYNWEPEEFSACSMACGDGFQSRNVWCRSSETREVVDDGLCNQILRPSNNQTCNNGPCQPTWVEGPWSPCSKRCGEGGTRSRQIQCQKIFTNGFPSIVADEECFNTLGPKPPLHEECNVGSNCPSWFTSPWKPCNKLCGEGKQTRHVICHQKSEGRVDMLPDDECTDEKPPAEQECLLRPCDGVDWVLSDWSGCDTCLSILRTRVAECASKDRKVFDSKFCAYHPTPELEQPCDRTKLPACTVQWYATQWSNCTVECGKGVKTRRVFCGLFDGASVQKVDDERCDAEDKYNDTVPCEIPEDKCPAKWFGGPWSECTKKCGGGEQFRRVMCLNRGVESSACDADSILDSTQACNTGPCDKDETLPFNSKSTPIMDEDYDYEECEEDEDEAYPEMGVEEVTPKGTDFSEIDLMFSDSPSTGEGSGTGSTPFEMESEFTIETGSGTGSTLTTDTLITEGSGTGPTEATGTETTESGATESTGSSTDSSGTTETATTGTGSTETEGTGSTETEGTGSTETEGTGSTETEGTGSTETEGTDSTETEGTGSTETEGTGSTETEGTGSTETEGTGSTETEGTGSTETESTGPTETTGTETTGTTESGATEASTTEGTESTATGGTKTDTTDTETTDESTTETGTTETGSTETDITESITTDTESTDTSSTNTETTESITTETETTVTGTTETGSTETTETGTTETGTTETGTTETGSTETTGTESSTTESGITETTETGSTETGTTETETTESITTETGSTEGIVTTESTTAGTTETGSTESSTTESGTEDTGSTEGSTTEGTTETGSTETTETGSTGTTESEGTSTTETATTGTEETGTTETGTTETGTTETGTTETGTTETGTTETGTTGTEMTGTTESGATETTESGATEISSTEGSSTTETEESSTSSSSLWDWTSTKKPHCKPRRPAKCSRSKFGCCPDKKTPAAGPFDEGCPNPKTCKDTKYGCCPDEVSPAGPHMDCPATACNETLFGCCKSDNKTAAQGNDQQDCPPPPTPCMSSKYGCCKDNKTEAKGPKKKGCPETEPKPKAPDCSKSKFGCCYDNKTEAKGASGAGCPCNATEFGCCPDSITAARGTDDEGCIQSCDTSAYGCCPDGKTPAHGPDQEGCCLLHPFGCCPDNYKPAEGPHLEGCGCQYARYGCCPDNVTIARGPRAEGCGCQQTQYGCCPDRHTEASGPDYEGCGCNTYQFGCCEDGITTAKGPNFQGCRCQESTFGCCGDEKTAANGPNRQGCDCSNSKYGCCPDGQTEAQGEKFLGCTDKPENRQAACSLKTDRGPCRNYSVYWFYDTDYGGCSRFWYGGCDGNGNRFTSKEECEDVCVQPPPKDACNLPRIKGACDGYHPRWYFDTERQQCGQFIYSGCLGNANNFDTRDLCQAQCEPARIENQCYQPLESGPCAGSFFRWGFNTERGHCEQFVWGGCGGTANRFDSEAACVQRCDPPGGLKPKCTKPQAPGECSEKEALWSFSQTENRCVPFYFTGCGGNENQFTSEQSCTESCPSAYVREVCTLPAMTGDCADYREKWYYDTAIKRCRQFYYGGCGGNGNKFDSEMECERSCSEQPSTPAPTPAPAAPAGDTCSLAYETGDCADYTLRWYYNTTLQMCLQFYYGGCGGNDNNFETQRDCEGRCGERAPRPSPVTVLTTTTTTTTSTAEPPTFVFDPANCLLPLDVGPCNDMTTQWGFDRAQDKCITFQFGGCGGNQNNFPTQDHCDYYCRQAPSAPVDICQQPMSSGPCEDSLPRWFYNEETDSCSMFMYSGCEGNENKFESREACESRCRRTQPITTSTTIATVTEAVDGQCRLPTSLEPCERNITAYYYDPRYGSCVAANIGGCPLANQYRSEEECLRTCGQFRGVDVCRYPVDAGSCQEEVPKFYWNEAIGSCEPFTYSGCYGGPNRFSTADECEQICGSRRPDTGDNEVDCDAFVEECSRLNCEYGIQRTRTADETCERCSCVQVETNCSLLEQECERLKCNYGMETATGADGCQRCKCLEHPCAGKQCGEQEKCVAYRDPSTADVRYISECRIRFRPGLCPSEEEFPTGTACRRECNDDVDCRGAHKCCTRGCQQICLEPVAPTSPAPFTTTYVPGPELPQKPQANPETQLEVTASESGRAVLRCLFHGNPPPKISWRRNEITIDGTVGRYQLHSDGALEIVSLYRNDSGVYICIADNALGTARQEVRLQVNDPVEEPAQIVGEPNAVFTGEFGGPLSIRCLAYGYPMPSIAWYRGTTGPMVPYSNEIYEARGNVLLIRSLLVNTLGEYVCQAYNAIGKPASWSVVVKAYRPAGISVDSPFFVEYEPETPATVPYVPPVYVPASTKIAASSPTLPSGSELRLYCRADGVPAPEVHWSKDGSRLASDSRTYLSETELRISSVTVEDSGEYGCHAVNPVSEHHSIVQINVQAAAVPALCTDNPFFANCTLIVRSKFCRHTYYSKLCCKSCVEAGQLNPEDLQMLSDQSWKKKK